MTNQKSEKTIKIMGQRVKNLYTHLIQNRKHELIGWYERYKNFSKDIETILFEKEITRLKSLIRKCKQFNEKVELNLKLKSIEKN